MKPLFDVDSIVNQARGDLNKLQKSYSIILFATNFPFGVEVISNTRRSDVRSEMRENVANQFNLACRRYFERQGGRLERCETILDKEYSLHIRHVQDGHHTEIILKETGIEFVAKEALVHV